MTEHIRNVLWVGDMPDAVESDFSVFHRVDDIERLSSARFFSLALRLVHYGGAVAFELRRMVESPRATSPGPGTPPEGTEQVPEVASLDDARALRDAMRRQRFADPKWGEMKRVSAGDLARMSTEGGTDG